MVSTGRLLWFMILVEVIGIIVILAGIYELVPSNGLYSAPVFINMGAVLIAAGGLGVAKVYDGETVLGDGGYPETVSQPPATTRPPVDSVPADAETEPEEDYPELIKEDVTPPPRISGATTNLIVKAAVKEQLPNHNVSPDFYGALDDKVAELLEDAARRAEENDRKTVQPRDL